MSPSEEPALNLIRELAQRPSIETYDTQPGRFRHFKIETPASSDSHLTYVVTGPGGDRLFWGGLGGPQQTLDWYRGRAAMFLGEDAGCVESAIVQAVVRELLIEDTHIEIGSDLLITCSPTVLERHQKGFAHQANPLRPSEALYIIGLYLRSRDDYTYSGGDAIRSSVGPTAFYRSLAELVLPHVQRSYLACLGPQGTGQHSLHTVAMASSVLLRGAHTLQALDEINIWLYSMHTWDNLARWSSDRQAARERAWDKILYHFDHLLSLLSGAMDVQARVAHQIHFSSKKTSQVSFRSHWDAKNKVRKPNDFCNKLKRAGHTSLVGVIDEPNFQDVLTLVREPRNTIHEVALGAFKTNAHEWTQQGNKVMCLLPVFDDIGQTMHEAADRLGGLEQFGLSVGHHGGC
jgi:hypothetical protein